MNSDRFRQIRHLFDAVLDHPGPNRTAFLAEASHGDSELRAEVERLLEAHQASTGVLDRPSEPAFSGRVDRWEGRRLGAYEILRELGRGGMGSVYLASRADQAFQRLVAIKIVRPEIDSEEVLRRFQREREILASLDHPNIARLLDAGTTDDGLPYFVLEYVDGSPIDAYCDQHRLDVDQRLKLIGDVCDAVEYAHRKRVVHRDLKPGNILVTQDGIVKLLDFGIAKLLRPGAEVSPQVETRADLRLMTPEYASPEQVRGEHVGFESDVYSLGVVLYELLTGRRPYRLKSRLMQEVVRVICEESPTKPSTAVTANARHSEARESIDEIGPARHATTGELSRILAGDLDSIVLKALEKDPEHRYGRPGELADDLKRRSEGKRISARAGLGWHRAWRLLQQHNQLALAACALVIAVAGGFIKVNLLALGVLSVMMVSFLTGYLVMRRELGPLANNRRMIGIALFVLTLTLLFFLLMGRVSGSVFDKFLGGLGFVVSVMLVFSLLRWAFRDRWSGALLLDLCRKRNKGMTVLAIVGFAGMAMQLFGMWMSGKHMGWQQFGLPISQALLFAQLFLLLHRVEFRQKGIFSSGMVRWNQVQSYSWDLDGDEFAYLKLRIRRFWIMRNTARLPIPLAKKPEAERILAEKLAEWPA